MIRILMTVPVYLEFLQCNPTVFALGKITRERSLVQKILAVRKLMPLVQLFPSCTVIARKVTLVHHRLLMHLLYVNSMGSSMHWLKVAQVAGKMLLSEWEREFSLHGLCRISLDTLGIDSLSFLLQFVLSRPDMPFQICFYSSSVLTVSKGA